MKQKQWMTCFVLVLLVLSVQAQHTNALVKEKNAPIADSILHTYNEDKCLLSTINVLYNEYN